MAATGTKDGPPAGSAADRAAGPLAEAVAIMARLRAPDGCPWDREQTFDSIKRCTLEETYEVFDAIERRAWPDLKDELGDLLLQVLFYAQMASEAGHFDLADVVANLNAKLIRRHPHVFAVAGSTVEASDSAAVLRTWERIKQEERAAGEPPPQQRSGLDGIARTMPAMLEAEKVGSRAAKVGFDWPDAEELFAKLDEEIAELKVEIDAHSAGNDGALSNVHQELGDVLFTVVNLARHLKVDTESALRGSTAKFRARFGAMETAAGGFAALAGRSPEELDRLWTTAKRELASSASVEDNP